MTLGCAAATQARAESFFQVEAGIGGSAYKKAPDGYWYQDGFSHDLKLTAPAIEVGLTGNLYQSTHLGLDWHLDWAWLGTVHTDALAVPDDANYNAATKGCNGPCLPLARFQGSGHDAGVFFSLEPHIDYGGWRFGIEAGPYLHRVTWSEDVTDDRRWSNVPIALHAAYSSGWTLGYMYGASVAYKHLSVVYQYFDSRGKAGDPYRPVWTGTHMLLLKYRSNVF